MRNRLMDGGGDDESDTESETDTEEEERDPEAIETWCDAYSSAEPAQGSVLAVRVDMRNRLMDRGHRVDDRYFWLSDTALWVSTVQDPRQGRQPVNRVVSDLACSHQAGSEVHSDSSHWHHGGLVNQPIFVRNGVAEVRDLEEIESRRPPVHDMLRKEELSA